MADKINLPKGTLSPEDLTKIGLKGIGIIIERTLRGEGVEGSLAPYSTQPFAMPAGAITAKARKALGDQLKMFTTKTGALWAIILSGYAGYMAAAYQDGNTVNLSATGTMLQNLTVVSTDPDTNTVILGFTTTEQALKAWYVNEAGRTPRKFLGFTEEEKAELGAWAATRIIIRA